MTLLVVSTEAVIFTQLEVNPKFLAAMLMSIMLILPSLFRSQVGFQPGCPGFVPNAFAMRKMSLISTHPFDGPALVSDASVQSVC